MKKIIPIISVFLVVCVVGFFSMLLFRTSNIVSVEIVDDSNLQTIYFVDSTNTVNFNDSNLKVTYKDGSVKLKKLAYDKVSVKNFTTSVENDGIMKITYKSKTIDVDYTVVCTGLYYLTEKEEFAYNGSTVSSKKSGPFVAGVTETNKDKTTTIEMIYFNKDGSCDYYYRNSSTGIWYMEDGYYNKSYYYTIEKDTIKVFLGEDRVYNLKAQVTNDGDLTLVSTENNYVENQDVNFLKSSVNRTFKHYEMKGNRIIEKSDIQVYCGTPITFKKDTKFSDSEFDIYLKVNYKNDTFLKNVYVRFNEGMFISDKEFTTAVVTPTVTSARCFYDGVYFELNYSVK